MSSFNGKNIRIELFGGSHDEKMGAQVFGLSGLPVDKNSIDRMLSRRAPKSRFSTSRREADDYVIERTGDKLIVTFYNRDVSDKDYAPLYAKPRPSHADYAEYLKSGTLDFSGGGRFSARLTAPLCVIGAVCADYLKAKGVEIAAYISRIGSVKAPSYKTEKITVERVRAEIGEVIPTLGKFDEVQTLLDSVTRDGDSVGGQIECIVEGLKPVGGEYFDGLEGKLSSALFAIPAVKAVEFGSGVDFAGMVGSEANDQMAADGGKVRFLSNHSGGILGGIAVGEPLTATVTFKPTPSISKSQTTVDLTSGKTCNIVIGGRHDGCVLLRAAPIVESMAAIALADEYLSLS